MLWKLCWHDAEADAPLGDPENGRRYVLHRHRDGRGAHWDLRLEQDGYLMGWRIEAEGLGGECLASEKGPHSMSWLEQDGDAVREDEGRYVWLHRDERGGELALQGRLGARRLRVSSFPGLGARSIEALCGCLKRHGVDEASAAGLIEDGIRARHRAMARLCGLGRELDGRGFDEGLWKKSLPGLSLREIERHLEPFEARFDAKYPPQPVSRPETLPEGKTGHGERVLELLRG